MSKVRHEIALFSPFDKEGMEARMERMAAEGWMIEKLGNSLWRYRAEAPKKQKFSVVWIPEASDFDPAPSEEQRELEELCARDGWFPTVQWGQMLVFRNEREDPVPIETDPAVQLDRVRRTMRRGFLPSRALLMAVIAFNLFFSGWQIYTDPIHALSGQLLYNMLAFLLLLCTEGWELLSYGIWVHRARCAAERGEFLPMRTSRTVWVPVGAALLTELCGIFSSGSSPWVWPIWLGAFTLTLVAANGIKAQLKKQGASRAVNQAISIGMVVALTLVFLAGVIYLALHFNLGMRQPAGTWVSSAGWSIRIYDDDLPLRVEDLMDVPEGAVFSAEVKKSETFALGITEYQQRAMPNGVHAPSLEYSVTEIKLPFLNNFIRHQLLNGKQDEMQDDKVVFYDHYEPSAPEPWGAQEAYRLHWSDSMLPHYLLFYEDRIIEINFDWDPTPEQIALSAQKIMEA